MSSLKKSYRAGSWPINWNDLELGNPGTYDRIQRRADAYAKAGV